MEMIFILFFYLYHLPYSSAFGHEITPIKAKAGLYYEPLHQVRFTRAEWKLTTAIHLNILENLRPGLTMNLSLSSVLGECTSKFDEARCQQALRITDIKHKESLISVYLDKIQRLLSTPQPITPESQGKRATPLAFIGSLSKSLFGTLNEDDAKYYNDEIDKLYRDQRKLTRILSNQTHIVKSSFHDFERNFTSQINASKSKIRRIEGILASIKREWNQVTEQFYFKDLRILANQIENTLVSFLNTLEHIIDAIMFAKLGLIHPELLTPARLEHAIKIFINQQKNYLFPIPLDEVHKGELEKISKISISWFNDKLILVIQIPLLEPTVYHLYHLHPYPTIQSIGNVSGSAYIQPRANYLIISHDHEHYSMIPDVINPFCQHTRYHYICIPTYPLYVSTMEPICEVTLLSNTVKNPHDDCDIRISKIFNPYWKQLGTGRGWLFSLPHEDSIKITCGEDIMRTIQMEGAGILQINPKCMAKTPYATMLGYETIQDTIDLQLDVTPTVALNVTYLLPEIHRLEPLFIEGNNNDVPRAASFTSLPGSLSNDATLSEIEQQLEELSTHERGKQQRNQLIHYSVSFAGLLIMIFIFVTCKNLIWKAIKKLKTLCTKKKTNQPEIPSNRPLEVIYDTPSRGRRAVEFTFPEAEQLNRDIELQAMSRETAIE